MEVHRVPIARRVGLWRAVRRSFSLKSLLSSLLLLLSLSYVFFCHFVHDAYTSLPTLSTQYGGCSQGYNLLPILAAVLLYSLYLAECWESRKRLSSLTPMSVEGTEEYLSDLREAAPQVWWKAICYHYGRKTRQVTRYRNGEALPASQVYYERVDSAAAEEVFLFDSCGVKDISGKAERLSHFSAVRVYVSRGFAFATANAAREFEEQRTRFFQDYEEKDDYLEVREGMQLSQSLRHILCMRTSCPWFLRPSVYWFFSLLLLSWPIRVISEWRTGFLHYRVIKLFGTNYLSPSSPNYTGPLSRCSTMDSMALVNGSECHMLPSYSMAILAPPPLRGVSGRGYGCIERADVPPPPLLFPPPRSTSFNTFLSSSHTRTPARSRSIAWNAGWSGVEEEESERLIPSQHPPPYEIALRLCAPLYTRIRQSLWRMNESPSIHSLPKHLPRTSH